MMNSLSSYITFRRKAASLHGVQPPFAYNFVKDVVKSNSFRNGEAIRGLSKKLKRDSRMLELRDLGAGSKKNKSNLRSISEIAKISSSRLKDLALFQRLIEYFNHHNILELGSNLGIGTCALASANTATNVVSIEGDPSLAEIARENLKSLYLSANVVQGAFEDELEPALKQLGSIDFAYIDGNHRELPTIHYYNSILKYCHEDSVLAFGDIKWSGEMMRAWDEIISDDSISLSMDFFHFGLVFFKRGLTKQNFLINY
jgi:predicted O-methyltransferase YrrM